jgi:hypothetical protein
VVDRFQSMRLFVLLELDKKAKEFRVPASTAKLIDLKLIVMFNEGFDRCNCCKNSPATEYGWN